MLYRIKKTKRKKWKFAVEVRFSEEDGFEVVALTKSKKLGRRMLEFYRLQLTEPSVLCLDFLSYLDTKKDQFRIL